MNAPVFGQLTGNKARNFSPALMKCVHVNCARCRCYDLHKTRAVVSVIKTLNQSCFNGPADVFFLKKKKKKKKKNASPFCRNSIKLDGNSNFVWRPATGRQSFCLTTAKDYLEETCILAIRSVPVCGSFEGERTEMFTVCKYV